MNESRRTPPSATGYRKAGVDLDAGDLAKQRIADRVAATHGPNVVGGIGHFGGMFRAPGTDNPYVLVSSADSVGTKVLVAALANSHRGIGIDLVNHCLNDILACGARPLFFLDYYATPKLDTEAFEEIIEGLSEACQAAGCALIGGETAQLPGIYREDAYDLAGFIVGQVHRDRVVDGSAIAAGDTIIGLPSNGLHTNGYSLARAALGLHGDAATIHAALNRVPEWSDRTISDLLLEPHRSYLADASPLLDANLVKGMAHITGGGLTGNVNRIIPDGLEAVIDVRTWDVPPLFREIQASGNVSTLEMYQVFNMGIGFVLVCAAGDSGEIVSRVNGARVIGEVRATDQNERARLIGLGDDIER